MSRLPYQPGARFCECAACGELFNSEKPFAAHRVGDFDDNTRRCLTPAEMAAKGWSLNKRGMWITAAMPTIEREEAA
jgi:hypothetical protein